MWKLIIVFPMMIFTQKHRLLVKRDLQANDARGSLVVICLDSCINFVMIEAMEVVPSTTTCCTELGVTSDKQFKVGCHEGRRLSSVNEARFGAEIQAVSNYDDLGT